jgi:alpha-1,6-mannosyltransferase
VPREPAVIEAAAAARRYATTPRPPARAMPDAPLRVVDVALFHGDGSGATRAYLEAKAAWADRSGLIDHHVVVPGRGARDDAGRHEVRTLRLPAPNGRRLPLLAGALKNTLRELCPDVAILHDPFWGALGVEQAVGEVGATVVTARRGSIAPDDRAGDTIALRPGIDSVFVPQRDVRRHDHVLYVGRLARDKGVVELLRAAARSPEPWQLKLVGHGPYERHLRRLAAQLGIADRVRLYPFIDDRARLARWYADARVLVMPGRHETFGLSALEAAATGTPVVTCSNAPSAAVMRTLAHTFEPGDIDGLLAAIETARASAPADAAGVALGTRCSWAAVFAAETIALERLVRGRLRLLSRSAVPAVRPA